MPSFEPYHQEYNTQDADDDFSVFAPGTINNADYVEADDDNNNDDDDAMLLPSRRSVRQHDHDHHRYESFQNGGGSQSHGRRRRNRGYPLSWCMDNQSESSTSSAGSLSGELSAPQKDTFGIKAKRLLGQILANWVVSLLIIVVTLGICSGLLYYSIFELEPKPTIDKSVTSFQIPNHNATRRQDALEQAGKEIGELRKNWRPKRETFNPLDNKNQVEDQYDEYEGSLIDTEKKGLRRRRQVQQQSKHSNFRRSWKIQVVYLAESSDTSDPDQHNIFTEERLEQIHQIEQSIMRHKDFMKFCYKNYAYTQQDPALAMFGNCVPLNSLLTYFYPSVDPSGMVHYNGLGSKLQDIEKTLKFAMTKETFYWYVDERMKANYRKSRLLRTEVQFGIPLEGFKATDPRDEQNALYQTFMKSMVELLKKSSTSKVKVLYGGNEVYDYQIESVFWGDVQLAVFSLVAIAVLMYILTSLSVWLTIWGIISIVLSFPMAFFLYRRAFGLASLGLLNGAAAFVIIGIGVDDVFVFINTFRQASHIGNHGDRMAHTVTTAGLATFFTSFTTAAAFAANIASAIPAVYEFGLFMSLIVTCCWLSVILIMPAAINLWVRARLALCEHLCYSRCKCCCSGSTRKLPPDIDNFLSAPTASASVSRNDTQTDGDVPLLGLEEEEEHREEGTHGGWMVYFGMLKQAVRSSHRHTHHQSNDDPLMELEVNLRADLSVNQQLEEGCGLTRQIQVWLYYYVARPVIRARWVVFGIFFVLLAISAGLMSQLKPSDKPPQLFDPNSNLQQLVDLSANFSDANIKCDQCSAFYLEGSVNPFDQTVPPTMAPPSTTTTTTTTTTKTTTTTQKPRPTNSPTTTTTTTKKPAITTLSPSRTSTDGGSGGLVTTTSPSSRTTTTTTTTTTKAPIDRSIATPSSISTTTTENNGVDPTSKPPSATTTTTTTKSPEITTSTPRPRVTTTTTPFPNRSTARPATPAPRPPATPSPNNPPPTSKPGSGTVGTSPPSPDEGYDPCEFGKCDDAKERPNMELGAAIYVVFGIKGIDRSNVSSAHVLTEKGTVVYDEKFEESMTRPNFDKVAIRDLCRICHLIANNTDLVKTNGSQCLPSSGIPKEMMAYLMRVPDCMNLPGNQRVNGKELPAKARAGLLPDRLLWIAFSFESTTFKGQSYFKAYNDYQRWEAFMDELRENALGSDSPLRGMFQTSEFWKDVMMEVVAVTSAIYGLLFSLIICVAAVAIFTGHFMLMLIVILTMVGEIGLVVAIFYIAGWQLGAVEAVSLSILVGTSVDYCMHLVEGYILAGKNPPRGLKSAALRQWRTKAAISHIGVSILSSAVTTIIAAVPLTLTTIRPFSKFGEIVAINTAASIVYTLTVCAAFLAIMGPARYRISCKSVGIAFGVTVVVVSAIVLGLFGAARLGVAIPGPSGDNLFPTKIQN